VVHLAGLALALVLAGLIAAALVTVWRAPVRALGVLVAGMSVHNFCLMLLLDTGVPHLLVRGLQAWKEAVLLVLGLLLVLRLRHAWREGHRPAPEVRPERQTDLRRPCTPSPGLASAVLGHALEGAPSGPRRRPRIWGTWTTNLSPAFPARPLAAADCAALAFAALLVLFLALPVGGHLVQRLLDFRALAMIPLLYLYGRVFRPAAGDLRWTLGLIAGSACAVVAFGLVELWFVPTRTWVDWGVNLLSAWDGRTYHGPGGLPENFVQATSAGPFLRRMVSTYVSPLGLAYVGLLLVPLAVSIWADRHSEVRWRLLAWASVVLVPAGVVLSVTRLAVALLVPELALLALLLPRPRTVAAVPLAAAAALAGLFLYVDVGPTVRHDLTPVRQPAGYALVHGAVTPAQADVPPPAPATPAPSATPRTPARARPATAPAASKGTTRIVFFSGDTSLQGHLRAFTSDLGFLADHPLGTGLGTYAPRFAGAEGLGESAVLGIFDEMGIPGGLVYLALYGLAILGGWRAFRATRADWTARTLPLVALVGGLALLPVTLTSDVWSGLVVSFLAWWAAGHSVTLAARPAVRAPQLARLWRAAAARAR
jgi:hypothetical protein